ncbi:MAG TPA: quercetin 2,3-dioxygenase [Thermoanaerobaculia bacterium]|nr:quercetin 2,3-dioxygenase [Thermoanaerobaculia bacterium]
MVGLTVAAPREGEAFWFLDTLMQVKLGGAATNGSLSVLEQLLPSGSATPMHRHDRTDEHFYVLEGQVTFYGQEDRQTCEAGSFVSIPRGTPHAFRVTSETGAKLLVISAPDHFERFVRSVSRPPEEIAAPPAAPPPGPEAIELLSAIGSEHDTVLLGPPPAVG